MPDASSTGAAAALGVLGLPAGATPEQITRAYRRLARATHPDVVGDTDPAAGDRFAVISDAYHSLASAPSAVAAPGERSAPAERSAAEERAPEERAPSRPTRPAPRAWGPATIVAGPVVVRPLPFPRRPGRERWHER